MISTLKLLVSLFRFQIQSIIIIHHTNYFKIFYSSLINILLVTYTISMLNKGYNLLRLPIYAFTFMICWCYKFTIKSITLVLYTDFYRTFSLLFVNFMKLLTNITCTVMKYFKCKVKAAVYDFNEHPTGLVHAFVQFHLTLLQGCWTNIIQGP